MLTFEVLQIEYKKMERLSQLAVPGGLRVMTTTTKDRLISFVNGLEIWGRIQLVKSSFRGLVV